VTEQPQSPEPATEVQPAATEGETPQVTPTAAVPEAAPAAASPDPAPVAAATEPTGGTPASGAYSGASAAAAASASADPTWSPASDPAFGSSDSGGGPAALLQERPEVAVGAAFAGGFVLAMILKRLAR
jgi:hypothetical protein